MSNSSRRPSIGIASLTIRDFRGIDRLELDFRGPDGYPNSLVVLAGPNGCGKTTVLEAALILAGGTKLIAGPRGKKAIRRGAKDYEIQGEFQDDGQTSIGRDTPTSTDLPFLGHPVPHWYFSSWRAPSLVGLVEPTVGRPGRRPTKNDQNRLRNVKQSLVNAATFERFQTPMFAGAGGGPYSVIIQEINNAWLEFYPDVRQNFAVEIVSPNGARYRRI